MSSVRRRHETARWERHRGRQCGGVTAWTSRQGSSRTRVVRVVCTSYCCSLVLMTCPKPYRPPLVFSPVLPECVVCLEEGVVLFKSNCCTRGTLACLSCLSDKLKECVACKLVLGVLESARPQEATEPPAAPALAPPPELLPAPLPARACCRRPSMTRSQSLQLPCPSSARPSGGGRAASSPPPLCPW